jgi:adenylate kinase family enzyme
MKIYVIYGNVSGGKGTLSKKLLETIPNSVHFCSDDIRTELSGDVGGASRGVKNGKAWNVWTVYAERVEAALRAGKVVIADSTGMSIDFVKMVNGWREKYGRDILVTRVFCDYKTWKEREQLRSDRWTLDKDGSTKPFTMPERAYFDSFAAKFDKPADIEIDTSNRNPSEVLDEFFYLESLK